MNDRFTFSIYGIPCCCCWKLLRIIKKVILPSKLLNHPAYAADSFTNFISINDIRKITIRHLVMLKNENNLER